MKTGQNLALELAFLVVAQRAHTHVPNQCPFTGARCGAWPENGEPVPTANRLPLVWLPEFVCSFSREHLDGPLLVQVCLSQARAEGCSTPHIY